MGAKAYYQATFNKGSIWRIFHKEILPTTSVGSDGISSTKFESIFDKELDIILRKTRLKTYSFSRYKEKLISKGHNKLPRQIAIPTVRDKLVLRAVHEVVKLTFNEAAPSRPQAVIAQIKRDLDNFPDSANFLRIDIKNFYPSIDHGLMLKKLRAKIRISEILHLIEAALKTPTGSSEIPKHGVPQGLSISNHMSSIYLLNFDKKAQLQCTLMQAKYYRYVDDIFIIYDAGDGTKLFNLLSEYLNHEKLFAHPLDTEKGKSCIVEAKKGLSYLGYEISTDGLTVKSESLQKMYNNILRVLGAFKYKSERNTRVQLFRLNLKITGCIVNGIKFGWLQFFSEIDKVHQLHQLDGFVQREAKKRLDATSLKEVKSFVRTFYEIKHRHYTTNYIPNFDSYDVNEKIELISFITAKPESEITNWEDDEIDLMFQKILLKETKKLEADVGSNS